MLPDEPSSTREKTKQKEKKKEKEKQKKKKRRKDPLWLDSIVRNYFDPGIEYYRISSKSYRSYNKKNRKSEKVN
jgi:hypothetical protein